MSYRFFRSLKSSTWHGALVSASLLSIGHVCHTTASNMEASSQLRSVVPTTKTIDVRKRGSLWGKIFNRSQMDSEGMLDHETDKYDGIIIKPEGLPTTKDTFLISLHRSLEAWKDAGKRGIWLKLPAHQLEYVTIATDMGFVMHHAEKDYLMLTKWLSHEENKLPPNASHQVGVGCVVLNADNKLLCVQEKNGPLKGMGVWKVPTGLADPQEDLADTARREVFEETGIETEFLGILCFRQAHNFLFGKSDLFFVCLLRPVVLNQEIVKQDSEIAACDWIDVDQYCEQKVFLLSPLHARLNHHIKSFVTKNGDMISSGIENKGNKKVLFEEHMLSQGFRPGMNGLYLPSET